MSAFDNIATTLGTEEHRAHETATSAVARIEVVVGSRHWLLRAALVLAACAVLGGGGYWQGSIDGNARYDAEYARFETYIADERVAATNEKNRQAAARVAVEAAADKRVSDAKAETAAIQGSIESYVAELARRPVSDRCTLTDRDLRGLRDFAPGATARPHRRPARAADASE